jgi:hypothetical protein
METRSVEWTRGGPGFSGNLSSWAVGEESARRTRGFAQIRAGRSRASLKDTCAGLRGQAGRSGGLRRTCVSNSVRADAAFACDLFAMTLSKKIRAEVQNDRELAPDDVFGSSLTWGPGGAGFRKIPPLLDRVSPRLRAESFEKNGSHPGPFHCQNPPGSRDSSRGSPVS